MTHPENQQQSPNVPSEASRVSAYAEAIWGAQPEEWRDRTLPEDFADQARAVVAVADAERADLRAEIERLKRGGAELGRILDRTLRDALDASGRHDVIEEDGDGDWALVWETLAELRPRAEAAEAEVERLRDLAQRNFKQGAALLGELQSAERARDAALAEVAELRDRLGRVEALCLCKADGCPCGGDRVVVPTRNLRAALAVPVTGDTEDASPAAEDAPRRLHCECVGGPHGGYTCPSCAGAASPTEQATEGGAK